MSVRSAVLIVFGCTLGAAVLGAGMGYALGQFVPGYYRQAFLGSDEPGFDPVSIGIGLGLAQGAVGGAVVGLALVVIFSIRNLRLNHSAASIQPREPTWGVAWWILLVTEGTLVLVLVAGAGFVLGELSGLQGAYHRHYLSEQRDLESVLKGDPAFSRIHINEFGGGGVYLSGDVSTDAELATLRSRVELAIGTRRAARAMDGVRVKE